MSQALLGEQAKSLFAQQTRDIREGLPGEFVDVGGDTPRVIREAPEQPQTTDDIKEYNSAVSNDGYEGTLEQWIKRQREAGAQRTTVSVNGDSIPAGLQDAAVKSSDQADLLRSQVTELQTFRDLAANTETGGLAPITLPFKQVLLDFGISVGEGVPLQEAFKAQENQMALRLRNPDSGFGLTGNTSNRDIEFLTGAVASLGKTPEGNQAILTIMLAKQRRGAELADLKSEYIWSTGSLKGWPDARKQFVEQNPFLLPEEQESLMQLKSSGLARLLTTDPASLTPEQLRELAGVQ
jgi:hypothetical protein